MSKEQVLQELTKLKKHKKSTSYYALKLGLTEVEIKHYLQELKKINPKYKEATVSMLENSREQKINTEKGTLESTVLSDFEPRNDEELATLHKVDLSKYKISSYWTKQKGDKFTSSLLCTLKKDTEFCPKKFVDYLENYTPPVFSATLKPRGKDTTFAEISLADFHLDKAGLNKETIEDRKTQYLNTLEELLVSIQVFNPHTYVFVIGNDFFQTDTYGNTTTKGTPVDTLVPFNESYEQGFDLLVNAILRLRSGGAYVHVINVSGNHARTKEFYLAHALSVFFKNDPSVFFDIKEDNLKFAVMGETFVGYHHGDCKKLDELPLIFATNPKSSLAFGTCKYREVKTGDKHYYLTKEVKGVRIQQLPSLSNTDRWHRDNLFVHSIRAGIASVYHPHKGKIAEFESRI